MKNKILSPEEWLKENCKKEDWSGSSECLHDGLLTNNVIQYMKDYAEYVKSNMEVHLVCNNDAGGDYGVLSIHYTERGANMELMNQLHEGLNAKVNNYELYD